jgi:hypothetical protein
MKAPQDRLSTHSRVCGRGRQHHAWWIAAGIGRGWLMASHAAHGGLCYYMLV